MAMLRSARGPLSRDDERVDDITDPIDDTLGMLPPDVGSAKSGGEGNRQTPTERNPSGGPVLGAGPEDGQVFAGGGSNTVSPPSVTQNQPPLTSLPRPAPESMVFARRGGGKLFGKRGGQFGGGLSLGGDAAQQGEQDPSALIEQLLKILG